MVVSEGGSDGLPRGAVVEGVGLCASGVPFLLEPAENRIVVGNPFLSLRGAVLFSSGCCSDGLPTAALDPGLVSSIYIQLLREKRTPRLDRSHSWNLLFELSA